MRRRVVVDANILILLAVGAVERSRLGQHRKLSDYSPSDFDRAKAFILSFQAVATTSHGPFGS